ncbi:hypothetical protein [Sulfurimonas sp.]|uniref:hypothetical protein n=1 Tax=Sulfurimonas sp. TaxID=2022749 RepID=UPI003565379E
MDTKKLLEELSEDCLSELTKHKYNKHLDISDRYRKGKIVSYEYILDLIYYFYEKDRALKVEFEDMIIKQIEYIKSLNEGDYQDGISDVLKWTRNKLNKNGIK